MNWRYTLILAILVLAGGAYFRFVEMKRPSTEQARQQAQNVVNFDRSKIDGIVIKNGDQQIEIRRRENKWRLETPIKDQADGSSRRQFAVGFGDLAEGGNHPGERY